MSVLIIVGVWAFFHAFAAYLAFTKYRYQRPSVRVVDDSSDRSVDRDREVSVLAGEVRR